MKKQIRNFFICGILGWCLEILYTALLNLRRRNFSLKGSTSVWMFPIYGMGCLILPLYKVLKKCSTVFRGVVYTTIIYGVEFLSGRYLRKKDLCPWDYSHSKWNIACVIRLDFLPYWFGTGLLFENILRKKEKKSSLP